MILKRLVVVVCALLATVGSVPCQGQDKPSGFFTSWEDRVRDTLAQQPSWPNPLVMASSGLLQVFRTDFVRQIAPAGTETWNYDNTKGMNVVPGTNWNSTPWLRPTSSTTPKRKTALAISR